MKDAVEEIVPDKEVSSVKEQKVEEMIPNEEISELNENLCKDDCNDQNSKKNN